MDTNAHHHVMGPPPSYESVVYGTDDANRVVQTGTNILPPPAQYPTAPYTYPVPSAPGNAASYTQYPTAYPPPPTTGTTIIHPPTIITANQPPDPVGLRRRRRRAIFCLVILPIVIFVVIFFSVIRSFF